MSTEDQIRDLDRRWLAAELAGDAGALATLTTDDFHLVGPAGFVLDKQQWLDRYRSGALTTNSLSLEEVDIRDYGHAAVAIGVQTQQATYQNHPVDGRFRVTHIAVRDGERWLLAGQHLSAIVAR
jgi:ketosteroid isomerase-like protein